MHTTIAAATRPSSVEILILIGVLIVLGFVGLVLLAKHGSGYWQGFARRMLGVDRREFPTYGLRDSLLTPGEARFYAALREAVGPEGSRFAIMAKVRLEDVLIIPTMERGDEDARSKRMSARGFVKSRHLDFLLCDPATLRPLLAIELDDASHQTPEARHGDDVKNKALHSAGLPLLRVRASGKYSAEEVRRTVTHAMGPATLASAVHATHGTKPPSR